MDMEYSFENEQYRRTYRHTTSHIMAQAIKRLYPNTKFAIGPAIDDGFYYDLDSDVTFTPEHLETIEAEMRKYARRSSSSSVSNSRRKRLWSS